MTNDYERASFKEILDILDPDLDPDFKQSSYYHNEFRLRLFNKSARSSIGRKKCDQSVGEILDSIKIVEPFIGNSDNYM